MDQAHYPCSLARLIHHRRACQRAPCFLSGALLLRRLSAGFVYQCWHLSAAVHQHCALVVAHPPLVASPLLAGA